MTEEERRRLETIFPPMQVPKNFTSKGNFEEFLDFLDACISNIPIFICIFIISVVLTVLVLVGGHIAAYCFFKISPILPG